MNVIDQFRSALTERQILPPREIVADGRIHRCDAAGKNGRRDAAYLLHLDGIPAGGFENHRDGIGWQKWRADVARSLSPVEESKLRAHVAAQRERQERKTQMNQERAARRALECWQAGAIVESHPYLTHKEVPSSPRLRVGCWYHFNENTGEEILVTDQALLVPMFNRDLGVVSLQGIFEDRDGGFRKLYLKHGAKEGKFCPLKGANDQALLICEGLATGLSLLQCTEYTVIVAFDAGNLLPVARLMRELRPRACILVCADNDSWTAGAIKNPGIHHATRAAAAVGGLVAFPQFADISTKPTDFNDLHQLEDEEAVSTVISRALAAGKVAGPNASSSETFGSDFHVR